MDDDLTLPMYGQRPGADLTRGTGRFSPGAHSLPAAIGPYRVIRLIGEGGMGAVYEAEQQQPRRTVALKVIKAAIATPDLIRRFQHESQALARLQHIGIAQVYDAGSAETAFAVQPYFAMEFIQGRRLTDYASEEQLSASARLELFCKICDAVHHAHRRGIIHRDLKPGNILVDETGQPKVLDFGIARLTDVDEEAAAQTGVGQLIGTLAYMSPEQVMADPLKLDLRTDVYSLGVVLYELLSGSLPYSFSSNLLHETVRTICEQSPSPLSSVNRVYRGDLETIVAKALEKDKNRRYDSAADLAADIGRYLDHLPIVARPATTLYVVGKIARRHRTLVSGVAAVFLVLLAGSVVSSWQAVRARRAEAAANVQRDRAASAEQGATRERDRAIVAEKTAGAERDKAVLSEQRATRERDRARIEKLRADAETANAGAINDFLQNDLLAQADSEAQANADNKPDPDMRVRTVLDRAALKVSKKFNGRPNIQASIESTIGKTYEGLGILAEAQSHYQSAFELRQHFEGPNSPGTLHAATDLGTIYRAQGKYKEAEVVLAKAIQSYRPTQERKGTEKLAAQEALGTVLTYEAKYPEAESLLNDALRNAQRDFPPEHSARLNIMLALAGLYFRAGRISEAEPLLIAVLDVQRRTLGPEHPVTLDIMNNLGVLYQRQQRYKEAEPILVNRLEIMRRIRGVNHTETLNALNSLGVLYSSQGKDSEAERFFVDALAGWRQQLGPEHPRTLALLNNLGLLYTGQGNLTAAEALLREAWEARRKLLGPEHPDTLTVANNLADVYRLEGHDSAAEELFNQILDARRRMSGPADLETAHVLSNFATLRIQQAKYVDAESLARQAAKVYAEKGTINFRKFRAEAILGASLAGQGKFAEGEPLLVSGCQGMKSKAAGSLEISRLNTAVEWILKLYDGWGKKEEAAEWRGRLR